MNGLQAFLKLVSSLVYSFIYNLSVSGAQNTIYFSLALHIYRETFKKVFFIEKFFNLLALFDYTVAKVQSNSLHSNYIHAIFFFNYTIHLLVYLSVAI